MAVIDNFQRQMSRQIRPCHPMINSSSIEQACEFGRIAATTKETKCCNLVVSTVEELFNNALLSCRISFAGLLVFLDNLDDSSMLILMNGLLAVLREIHALSMLAAFIEKSLPSSSVSKEYGSFSGKHALLPTALVLLKLPRFIGHYTLTVLLPFKKISDIDTHCSFVCAFSVLPSVLPVAVVLRPRFVHQLPLSVPVSF
mmetsp:Transcript_3781/g.5004  ORF Transcript_3781/g.5004 Transcript_3781/m.5004 type:complete len:200 (-) Transcript_3781:406-1005(-)